MKEWIKHQYRLIQCLWFRHTKEKELISLVFSGEDVPEIGDVVTDNISKTEVLVVDSGVAEDSVIIFKGYIIHQPELPPHLRPLKLPFINPDLPTGSIAIMGGVTWIKNNKGGWVIYEIASQIEA